MKTLQTLDPHQYWNMWHEGLSMIIKEYYERKRRCVTMLEAGCGRESHLDMTGIDYLLTGVDVSEEVLKQRKSEQKGLHEIVVGDLRTIEFKEAEFDVIYCSYVLEHISGAEDVLTKFFRWLKPGGVLLLLIPDRDTIRGLVTRITPFWFHVAYYRYVKNIPDAGKPGFGPFVTYYEEIVSRKGIHDYCDVHGYKIAAEYGDSFDIKSDFGMFSPLFRIFFGLVRMVTFGRIATGHSDVIFVIEKEPALIGSVPPRNS